MGLSLEEKLVSVIISQGGDIKKGGLFNIDREIEGWIKKNLFNQGE